MRLLHTTRLEFEEFFDDQIPPYAILSHRWGPDEVSYHDFLAGRKRNGAGDEKILACCTYAAHDRGFGPTDWVWIDTCCIDKSSSAELAEAINSMFEWYQKAIICYAYLSDVRTEWELENSQWFRRGWTLQEMIAPKELIFLDRDWVCIGTRGSHKANIARATGIIGRRVKDFEAGLGKQVSVTEKLSWAAERVTSRREDQAYCLLGLFEINMPLLYGEGDRAFERLQKEIIRSSNDEPIFVWDMHGIDDISRGVLADSPNAFRNSCLERDERCAYLGISRPPFVITNQGLEFRVPKRLVEKASFLLPLSCLCYRDRQHVMGAFAIHLRKNGLGSVWKRVFSNFPQDGMENFRYSATSSLYVVPVDWVWSREKLAQEETEVIYLKITH